MPGRAGTVVLVTAGTAVVVLELVPPVVVVDEPIVDVVVDDVEVDVDGVDVVVAEAAVMELAGAEVVAGCRADIATAAVAVPVRASTTDATRANRPRKARGRGTFPGRTVSALPPTGSS